MSIISAGTSSSTAVKVTGNTDGTLVLKTNDTGSGGTTALTLATNQAATFASSVSATTVSASTAVVQGGAAANYAGNFRDATVGGSCYLQITTNASGSANTDGLVWGLDTASPPNGYLSLKENATLYLQANSATVGAFSSTGLAVTGTLSSTGEAAIGGSSQQVKINRVSDATAYGAITFNNDFVSTTMTGLFGRGSGGDSGRLFYNVPTGQIHNFTVAGTAVAQISSTGLAVTGQISGNNAIFGIRNNITSTDRISVTGATTIFSIATGGSSVGASGAVLLVNGYNTASSTNSFIDLVLFIGSNTPTVLGSVNRGSPAARTYTASGSNLQLAMASGTYNVASSSTEQAC